MACPSWYKYWNCARQTYAREMHTHVRAGLVLFEAHKWSYCLLYTQSTAGVQPCRHARGLH